MRWLKSLRSHEKSSLIQNLVAANTSTIAPTLEALKLLESNTINGFNYSLRSNSKGTKVIVKDNLGEKFGVVTSRGFKPYHKAKEAWNQINKVLEDGPISRHLQGLDKWAARELINISTAFNSDNSQAHILGDNASLTKLKTLQKEGEDFFGDIDDIALNPDLVPDWGGTFSGKTWVLTQASPSKLGSRLDHTKWMGAINTGRAQSLAVDPTDKDNLIVGMEHAGLWHSKDGGNSWEQVSDQDLGAPLPPNNFSHLAAYKHNNSETTLLLGFSYKHLRSSSRHREFALVSQDGGESWEANMQIANQKVRDTLRVGDKLVIASHNLIIYDTTNDWSNLLTGSSENMLIGTYKQLKPIPGDNDRLIGLDELDNKIYLIDLRDWSRTEIARPATVIDGSGNGPSIDTAILGNEKFRLYYFYPRAKGDPVETPAPARGSIYSIDLDLDFTQSSRNRVDLVTPEQPNSDNWVAWGYETQNDAGDNVYRSSAGDSLKAFNANDWGRRDHFIADPVFPDKAYVGGMTLGFALHPSVPVENNPEERGVAIHWDPAGWNSYVCADISCNESGSGRVNRDGEFGILVFGSLNESTAKYYEEIESGNNKTHADAQLLYTDGTHIYYGNDGGLNRSKVDPDPGHESITFKSLGLSYTWEDFKEEIKTIDFTQEQGNIPNGLADLPWLGFYQPNWENLNFDLISNLYRGGTLGKHGEWITGSQDNGVSVGSGPNTSPYLVSNGDGGHGFYGDHRERIAFTNQSTDLSIFEVEGSLNASSEASAVTTQLWSKTNGYRGTLNNNIIGLTLSRNQALLDIGEPLNSQTLRTGTVEQFFRRAADGSIEIFPDFVANNKGSRSLRKNMVGEQTSIQNIHLKWVNYNGISRAQAGNRLREESINSESFGGISALLNDKGGELWLEIDRDAQESEHLRLDIVNIAEPDDTEDFRLAVKGEKIYTPQLRISFDGGDTVKRTMRPMNARDSSFYFPAEQHPANRNIIGIADAKRIFIYRDAFNPFTPDREKYSATVDLDAIQQTLRTPNSTSRISSFAFAPWDQTGNTLLVGFRNGKTILIRNAIDDSDSPTAEAIAFGSGAANSVAFSHNNEEDYTSSDNAFFVTSHSGRQRPEINRYIAGSSISDPSFNTGPSGKSNHSVVVDNNLVYSASNEGVHQLNVDTGSWTKIGGNYSDNLPNTNVYNLAYKGDSDRLYAFTYGRGVYYYDTKLSFTPDGDTEIWELPPRLDLEKNQFVRPLDLVELILRIDDPRINPSTQFILNDANEVEINNPNGPIFKASSEHAETGHWFDQTTSTFLHQKELEKDISFFANSLIHQDGKIIEKFDLKPSINKISSNDKLGVNAIYFDIAQPYNAAASLIQKDNGLAKDIYLTIDYGFSYKSEVVSSGRKLLLFDNIFGEDSDAVNTSLSSQWDAKQGSLRLFSNDTINLNQCKALTPVIPMTATKNLMTPLEAGIAIQDIMPATSFRANVYSQEKFKGFYSKPITKLNADRGNRAWWQPSQNGKHLINIEDRKGNPLVIYEATVTTHDSSNADLAFFSRFKGFEAASIRKMDMLTGTESSPLSKILTAESIDHFPLKKKMSPKLGRHVLKMLQKDLPNLKGKDLLDAYSPSNDFLLDYVDLNSLRKNPSLSKDFYSSVEWGEVDFSALTGTQEKLIDWKLVDPKAASQSPNFPPKNLSTELDLFSQPT